MNDSYIDKTEDEIRQNILQIAREETGLTNFKSVGVLRGFFETFTRVITRLYFDFLNFIYKQNNLEDTTGIWLTFWGLKLGVKRKLEEKTQGNFTGHAYTSGTIQAGTWIVVEGTKLRFKVTETISFIGGNFQIPVIAEFEGSQYNIASFTDVRSTSVVMGLDSITVEPGWISSLGQDTENDDSYRNRIYDRWNDQGEGTPPSKYEYLAASITGVAQAKVIRTPRGWGSMDVIIASEDGLPSQTLIDAVEAVFEDEALISRDFLVRGPTPQYQDFQIEYAGDKTEAEIEQILRQFINNIHIGGRLEIRKLYDAYDNLNLTQFEVIQPSRDIILAPQEMIIPQNITITKVAG